MKLLTSRLTLLAALAGLAAQGFSQPANDTFANRISLAGTSIQSNGSNVDATKEAGEPDHAGNGGGKSVWWTWTAPASGGVTLSTEGSSFDTLLGVYQGISLSGLSQVGSNDNRGTNFTSLVSFNAVSNQTYQVAVDGFNGAQGNILLSLSLKPGEFHISSAPREDFWIPDNVVNAVLQTNGIVYIAGSFHNVVPNGNKELLVDTSSGLRDPRFPAVDGVIFRAIPDARSGWYIGGEFSAAGGVPRRNLVHVMSDNTVDANFTPDPNNWVGALVLSDSVLYVGGAFTNIAGQLRNNLAALDPVTGVATAWNPSATFFLDPSVGRIEAMELSGNTLYVGGLFHQVGNQVRRCIAALDATTGNASAWAPESKGDAYMFLGILDGYGEISALKLSGGLLYAAGSFTNIGGQTRSGLAALDLTTGAATAWDPDPDGSVFAIEASCDTIYVAGYFGSIGGRTRANIAALEPFTGVATAWNPGADAPVYDIAVSGNAIYAGGIFTTIGGQARRNLAALDMATGRATAWNPRSVPQLQNVSIAGSKLLAGGNYPGGGLTRNFVAAIDVRTGQPTAWNPSLNGPAFALAYSSNTVYVAGDFTSVSGQARVSLVALDAGTGAVKPFQADLDFFGSGEYLNTLAISGNILYVGGYFTRIRHTARLGLAALDATTGKVLAWNPGCADIIHSLAVSDNTVYIAGDFSSGSPNIAGVARSLFAAVDATTGVATPWNPNADPGGYDLTHGYDIAVAGNTVFVAGDFPSIGGAPGYTQIARVHSDGSLAAPFQVGAYGENPASATPVETIALQPDGKILIGGSFTVAGGQSHVGIARFNADGSIDGSFQPYISSDRALRFLALQPDGKILCGGNFEQLNGQNRLMIGRLNANGTLDTSFNANLSANYGSALQSLALQPDGKILVGPWDSHGRLVTFFGGQPRTNIARLNADGTLDTNFNASANSIIGNIKVQPDGKILLSGSFTLLNGQVRTNLGRLNSDGTFDPSFRSDLGSTNAAWGIVALQADGKILVDGSFRTGPFATPPIYRFTHRIALLNSDGSTDSGFPGFELMVDGAVTALLAQPDGKLLVAGTFNTLQGQPRTGLGRLNPDGSLDTNFAIPRPNGLVECLALAADGTILFGGRFNSLGSQVRSDLAALDRTSAYPSAWNPNPNPNSTLLGQLSIVANLALSGSTLYCSGTFSSMDGQQRNHLAGLDVATGTPNDWSPTAKSSHGEWDVYGLSAPGHSIYAGGIFTTMNDKYRPNLAAFPPVGSPVITRPPNYQLLALGQTIRLETDAAGQAPLSYQWQFNGTNVPGATNASLEIANAQISHSGDYTAVVTNLLGLVASSPANVTIVTPVVIVLQPQNRTVAPGASFTLSVTASGNPPPSYQWRINGVSIPGATASTLTITNAQPTNGGSYQVVVANIGGAALSDIATVLVTSPALPFADNLSAAGTLIAATGVGSASNIGATKEPGEANHVGIRGGRSVWVAWVAPTNGVATFGTLGSSFDTVLAIYTGTNIASLLSVAGDEDHGGFYTSQASFNAVAGTKYLIAVDGFSAASGNIVLSWNLDTATADFPKITAQPLSLVVTQSQTATFSVMVLSPPPLRYQWFLNCMPIPEATNATLTVTNVRVGNLGNYHVVVQNASTHPAESFDALLQIGPVPGVFALDKVEDDSAGPATALRTGPTALRLADVAPGFVSVSVGTIDGQLFNNNGAASSLNDPTNCFGYYSVWFDVRAEQAGVMVIDTMGSEIDTLLAVYFKLPAAQLYTNLLACDNNGAPDGLRSLVRFTASAGQNYYAIVFGATAADRGLVHLNWKMGQAPQFQGGPTHSLLRYGDSLLLSSPAPSNGLFPIRRMQWLRDGVAIAGATNSTLSLVHLLGSQSGAYSVMASNDFGATTNVVALVAVDIPYLGFEPRPVNGAIRVWLQGPPGQIMILESSSDLRSWIPWSTNSTDQNSFRDIPADAMPQQFFRARPR